MSFAATDDDRSQDLLLEKDFGAAAAGVFHEDEAWESVIFDGAAVEISDLVA
jgi:hypothetical protein